jgi:hypothetical protein
VRQFVYTIERAFYGWISFALLNRKLGRALIACARLVSFKFFFQCKAFWYSFRCLVSNVFCSLHADRCFRSETTSERYFLRNCVSITLYLFVLLLVFGIPAQMLDCWINLQSKRSCCDFYKSCLLVRFLVNTATSY